MEPVTESVVDGVREEDTVVVSIAESVHVAVLEVWLRVKRVRVCESDGLRVVDKSCDAEPVKLSVSVLVCDGVFDKDGEKVTVCVLLLDILSVFDRVAV